MKSQGFMKEMGPQINQFNHSADLAEIIPVIIHAHQNISAVQIPNPIYSRKKAIYMAHFKITRYFIALLNFLQCFDAVGWAAGRVSGL